MIVSFSATSNLLEVQSTLEIRGANFVILTRVDSLTDYNRNETEIQSALKLEPDEDTDNQSFFA